MPMFVSVCAQKFSFCWLTSKFLFFFQCLADLKANKQSNIPMYSFAEHQRLEDTKYLYGATIIISEHSRN